MMLGKLTHLLVIELADGFNLESLCRVLGLESLLLQCLPSPSVLMEHANF